MFSTVGLSVTIHHSLPSGSTIRTCSSTTNSNSNSFSTRICKSGLSKRIIRVLDDSIIIHLEATFWTAPLSRRNRIGIRISHEISKMRSSLYVIALNNTILTFRFKEWSRCWTLQPMMAKSDTARFRGVQWHRQFRLERHLFRKVVGSEAYWRLLLCFKFSHFRIAAGTCWNFVFCMFAFCAGSCWVTGARAAVN